MLKLSGIVEILLVKHEGRAWVNITVLWRKCQKAPWRLSPDWPKYGAVGFTNAVGLLYICVSVIYSRRGWLSGAMWWTGPGLAMHSGHSLVSLMIDDYQFPQCVHLSSPQFDLLCELLTGGAR